MKATNLFMAGLVAAAATFGLTSCSQDEPAVNSTASYGAVTRSEAMINSNIKVFAYCNGHNDEQASPEQKYVYEAFNGRVISYTTSSTDANIALVTDRSVNYKYTEVKAIYNKGGKIVWTLPSKQVFENFVNAQDWLPNVTSQITWDQNANACTAIILCKVNGAPVAVKYDNVKDSKSLPACVNDVVNDLNNNNVSPQPAPQPHPSPVPPVTGQKFNASIYSWCDGNDGHTPSQGTAVYTAINNRMISWNENANIGLFTDESINSKYTKFCNILQVKKGVVIWANPTKQNFENFVKSQPWLRGIETKVNWNNAEACTAIVFIVNGDSGVISANIYDNYKPSYKPLDEMINTIVNDVNNKHINS